MNRIFTIFGYEFEKASEKYEEPFKLDDSVSHSLLLVPSKRVKWSYGFQITIDLHYDGGEAKKMEFMANYNIITHRLKGENRLTYDSWESKEPIDE